MHYIINSQQNQLFYTDNADEMKSDTQRDCCVSLFENYLSHRFADDRPVVQVAFNAFELADAVTDGDDGEGIGQHERQRDILGDRVEANVAVFGIDEEAVNARILEESKKLWGDMNHCTY